MYYSLLKTLGLCNRSTKNLVEYPRWFLELFFRHFWVGIDLGLYQTILLHPPIFKTKKSKVIYSVAKLKRFLLDDDDAKLLILSILNNNCYVKWHKRFIIEVFYLYPEVFVDFFSKNPIYLKDIHYCGLYLSYINYKNISNQDFQKNLYYYFSNNNINKYCLINNASINNIKNQLKLLNHLLSDYALSHIKLKSELDAFFITNFISNEQKSLFKKQDQVVSVLVTAYNAQKTLAACLESLLNQTWQSLEVIVIDDASIDNTFQIIQQFIQKDNRIIGIHLPKNVGTFAAKSIGAEFATGEFLTCQDSDDFAHPQKIERQILPLIKNKNLVATTSYWLRITDKGQYYARQYYPFLRYNPASPLFRLKQIKNDIGLWHLVRSGADSEFWHRLRIHYGDKRIEMIKEPLTFASHRIDSLMNSGEFNVHQKKSALRRLDYWEAWNLWHINCLLKKQPLYMPSILQQTTQNLFMIDKVLFVNTDNLSYNLDNLIIKRHGN